MKLKRTAPVICIDPGTTHSGVVIFNGKNIDDAWSDYLNDDLIVFLRKILISHMAIEGIASYGMSVGATTFETVEWIGRFREAFGYKKTTKIYRKDVKMFLCGSMRAKDANIRRRILDLFPPLGGGKTPQVGIKKNPGPLYGISSHSWSALAVGLTYKYGNI